MFLFSSLENQFNQFKLIKGRKWRWTGSHLETEGQFLRRCEHFSFCRDARRVGNGDLPRKERRGGKKSLWQSVRAWEQLPAVGLSSQRQAGQRGDKENSHTRSLQGRRCGDNYLLLGC